MEHTREQLNAIDFLLYSYFSFSLESLRCRSADEILDRLIARAYQDAARHVLSIESGNPREEQAPEQNPDRVIHKAIVFLRDREACDYNCWHRRLCARLERLYAEKTVTYKACRDGRERRFSFGIAQKWVNMTMKNMLIVCDLYGAVRGEEKTPPFIEAYGELLSQRRAQLHAPVDTNVIAAARQTSGEIPLPAGGRGWSAWEPSEYHRFQNALPACLPKGMKSVIDWESEAWIRAAEKKTSWLKSEDPGPAESPPL